MNTTYGKLCHRNTHTHTHTHTHTNTQTMNTHKHVGTLVHTFLAIVYQHSKYDGRITDFIVAALCTRSKPHI